MVGVNKVILVGNLGRDPEIKSTNNGARIALFSVATSERWRDRSTGENQERTEWHKVVVFNDGLVGVCERFLKKGSKIYLEGQLQTRKWQDQAGQDRYTTEVVLGRFKSELVLLDGRSDGVNDDMPDSISSSGAQPASIAAAGGGQEIALDDDIPF